MHLYLLISFQAVAFWNVLPLAMQRFTLALWNMHCVHRYALGSNYWLQILRPYGAGRVVRCSWSYCHAELDEASLSPFTLLWDPSTTLGMTNEVDRVLLLVVRETIVMLCPVESSLFTSNTFLLISFQAIAFWNVFPLAMQRFTLALWNAMACIAMH